MFHYYLQDVINRREKKAGISVQNDKKNKDSATELSMTMTDPLYIHRGRRKVGEGVKSEGTWKGTGLNIFWARVLHR